MTKRVKVMWAAVAVIVAFVALYLSGVVPGTPAHVKSSAKDIIASGLRDPAAAQFKNIIISQYIDGDRKGKKTVCGAANGKNAYGAYTGFRSFIVDVETGEVTSEPDAPHPGKSVGEISAPCEKAKEDYRLDVISAFEAKMICEEVKSELLAARAALQFQIDWARACSL